MADALSTIQRGAAAESAAAAYLQARGLDVIARNLRSRGGELDLVCHDGELLVIVEVRQRCGLVFGGAVASVNASKRRRLVRAALFHWQRIPEWRSRRVRFDVIALQGRRDGSHDITWIKDAFRA